MITSENSAHHSHDGGHEPLRDEEVYADPQGADRPHANALSILNAESASSSFENPEITPKGVPDTFDAILAQCTAPSARQAIFKDYEEQLLGLLPAFTLYCMLLAELAHDDQSARPLFQRVVALVAADPSRKRGPKKGNLALLGLLLSARPQSESERKTCSDLACLFEHATDCAVTYEGFLDWAMTVTVDAALEAVRSKHKAAKLGRDENHPAPLPPTGQAASSASSMRSDDGLATPVIRGEGHGIEFVIELKEHERTLRTFSDFVTGAESQKINGILAEGAGYNLITVLCSILDVLQSKPPGTALQVATTN